MKKLIFIFIIILSILILNKQVYALNTTVNLEEVHIYEGDYYINLLKPTRFEDSVKNKYGELTKVYSYSTYLPQYDILLKTTYCDYSEPHAGQIRRHGFILAGDLYKDHEIGIKIEYGPRLGKLEKYVGNLKKLLNGMYESTLVFKIAYNNENYVLCSKMLQVDSSHFYQLDYIGNVKSTSILDPKKWMESFRLEK